MTRQPTTRNRWLIAVDTGGTFIDAWARDPRGREQRRKLLSSSALRARVTAVIDARRLLLGTSWETAGDLLVGFTATGRGGARATVTAWEPRRCLLSLDQSLGVGAEDTIELTSHEEPPVLAARLLTGTPLGKEFPDMELRLSTTRATNALLERKGARVAFITTTGFGDLLDIGDQRRPDLFALEHRKPDPVAACRFEIDGRIASDGRVLEALDERALESAATEALAAGCESAAVAFVNSYANPGHEERAEALLARAGFRFITLSSRLSRRIKLLPRAQTASVDAYLSPILQRFISNVGAHIRGDQDLLAMTSAGGLETAHSFRAKDSLFSGPAGGVAGAAAVARSLGLPAIITFDMGGTSTDVARWDGEFDYASEQHIGDTTLIGTSLRIETVAAGGGSICSVKPSGLSVGPESAGAMPGPACYGFGGPLTLTDVNLLLGRLDPGEVSIPLDRNAAQARLRELIAAMQTAGLAVPDTEESLLLGLLDIAVEHMAEAIRRVSVRHGYDPSAFTLVAFGGAGPQHACAIAERLGMRSIVVPEKAGILSACGVGAAALEHFAERQLLQLLPSIEHELDGIVSALDAEALAGIAGGGRAITARFAELRLAGQDSTIAIPFESAGALASAFAEEYARLYGYPLPRTKAIELVAVRVRAATAPTPVEEETFDASVRLDGPALRHDAFSTLYVAAGWSACRGSLGSWQLSPQARASALPLLPGAGESRAEAVRAELFRNRFTGIAGQMGVLLQRTALSTNVKERLDFSCAVLSAQGELVVNAPHIPVHLGALGECVRRCVERLPLGAGDVLVTNHPAFGGSHLPDITVMAPLVREGRTIAYCAARAHHSELGGISPGSMPAGARSLEEEGVVIAPMLLMQGGQERYAALQALLLGARFPTRSVDDNLADIHAQVAAVRAGLAGMGELCDRHGVAEVEQHLAGITDRTAAVISGRLAALAADLPLHASETLDDGTTIAVALQWQRGRLMIDFSGTSPPHPGNLNATPAIVRSAILYVLRLLLREDLPLNEGLLRDVQLRLPVSFLNPPFPEDSAQCPAVVGGNVETSQRLVDTLMKAFAIQACSQGTMNNVIFGNASFGYYETLCGGAGAGPGYDGADALHTHMTNTAITDVEVLEHRYPVRISSFSIRANSGGAGRFRGGDGIMRCYEFLEPLTVSLLTEHRKSGPFGLMGGSAGRPGRQAWITGDGAVRALPSRASIDVRAGDRLIVETPGGGGCGNLFQPHPSPSP